MKTAWCVGFRNYFREYCNQTSVHGCKYIGERNRPIFERIWWFFTFLTSLSACAYSIYLVYKKWDQSPVIVNFTNTGTPLYEIPFPAVTICPESKSEQDIFSFTQVMQKKENGTVLDPLENTRFEYMSLICRHYPHLSYSQGIYQSLDFFKVIEDIQPKFTIEDCYYLNMDINCDVLFTPIITDEGICYTFNMIDRTELFRENVAHYKNYQQVNVSSEKWSLQDGYTEDAGLKPYPVRAYLSGASYGFRFNILTPKKNLDHGCTNPVMGYRVVLHTPMTVPRPSQKFFRIPLHQSVVASVHPTIITTSKRIKMYDPDRRNCYFGTERRLKYFKKYTSSNCKLECLTNYTLVLCGCVNYFMPRENHTMICGASKINCMRMAENVMHETALTKKLSNVTFYKELEEFNLNYCKCLPICSDLTYEADTTQTDWDWSSRLESPGSGNYNNSYLSTITIFFKTDNFFSSERNELYGPIDFLANFGGLLGLFTGFSVLSLMEILYFLSIRILCNLHLYGGWAGKE